MKPDTRNSSIYNLAHSFTDDAPLLRDGFDGGLGVLKIGKDSLLDRLI